MDTHISPLADPVTSSAQCMMSAARLMTATIAFCIASTCLAADTNNGTVTQSDTLKDPTLPPAQPTKQEEQTDESVAPTATPEQALKVQMIVRGPGESHTAIVNGQALRVGSQLAAMGGMVHIVRITSNALTVRTADKTIKTIELLPDSTLQAVRCKRTVGARTLPCLSGGVPTLEKTQ